MEAAEQRSKESWGGLKSPRPETRGSQRPRTGRGTPRRGRWALSALPGALVPEASA